MSNSAKDHYTRIIAEMEKEDLLTFEELLNLTKISPTALTKTIQVLARERFPVKLSMEKAIKKLSVKANKDDEVPDKEEAVEIMTFEEMVLCTKTHPLYLERSLRKIARLSQMS
ncbi:uncharacterized protein LOC119557479 [Drosophila subpulchrella]|uniref:uncharacterized protein LOC119557479 n=1 Tax=Drosophila subpulchrella TaxID=1486046 RepID=UPI0018A14311|nr:uncharacterized protein LOC119557479 [Drosophila subpulchrella]